MKNKLLFIAATHGNEEFSVNILEELEKKLPKNEYDWIVGNPRALAAKARFIDVDLNRSAPGDINSDLYEEKRAAEIIEISKNYEFVIDIHGSNSNCGICTIISYPTSSNINLAKRMGLKHNVIWYSKDSDNKGPLNQYVKAVSIELECGPKNDPVIQNQLAIIIENIVLRINNTDDKKIENTKQEYYSVYGKEKDHKVLVDFIEIENNGEKYYPFLSNNKYKDISHYKMKKIDPLEATFLVNSK